MKKSVFITNLLTLLTLCFMAVKNGVDAPLLAAIATSAIANGLGVACMVKEAGERK